MSEITSSTRAPGGLLSPMRAGSWQDLTPPIITAQPRSARMVAAAEPPRPVQPERRLLVSLLHTALDDLHCTHAGRDIDAGELRELAREWIAGAAAPITFAWVCEMLEIDTDAARAALLDERHPARAAVLFEIGALAAA